MNDEGIWSQKGESKVTSGCNPSESYLKPKARRSEGGRSDSRVQVPDHSETVAIEWPIQWQVELYKK